MDPELGLGVHIVCFHEKIYSEVKELNCIGLDNMLSDGFFFTKNEANFFIFS